MIRAWLIGLLILFFIRLVRTNLALVKKIIIGTGVLALCAIGYLLYSQLYSTETQPSAVIAALDATDTMIEEYHNSMGQYPNDVTQLVKKLGSLPDLPSGYILIEGYNITTPNIVYSKTADTHCAAYRAAVMINFTPYDAEHVRQLTGK